MRHLLVGCPFSRSIWHEVLSWIRSTAVPSEEDEMDFVDWWLKVSQSTPRALRKGTSSLVMLTAWWIWKLRNSVVFENISRTWEASWARFNLRHELGLLLGRRDCVP
uniref:Uncharacterized protein n=1 Tax=Avena sativa TaxID=4498 RepID=A0ACD5UTN6_AVESA